MRASRLPKLSTASLPDIVFLLLFFFMVSSVMRQNNNQLQISEPSAEEVTKIDKKILIKELNIGHLRDGSHDNVPKISDGKKSLEIGQLVQWVFESRSELPEHLQNQMIVMIKADKDVHMGLISDVGEELRKANARKVLYRTLEKYED